MRTSSLPRGGKRVLSLLMAVVLAIGLMPLPAYALSETLQAGSGLPLSVQDDDAGDETGTDPTDLWNGSNWSYSIFTYINRVQAEGVGVKEVAWDGDTCNVTLVPSTKKEQVFNLNITLDGASRNAGVKINGSNVANNNNVVHTMELADGQASVSLIGVETQYLFFFILYVQKSAFDSCVISKGIVKENNRYGCVIGFLFIFSKLFYIGGYFFAIPDTDSS